MTFFTATLETITIRFFLMMGIIIGSFFSGFPILGILALPVFLAALTGVSFTNKSEKDIKAIYLDKNDKNKMNTAA